MIPLKCVFLLLGALSLVGSNKVNMKKCPKRFGLFPKPGSFCKEYYSCSNWIPVEEVCPDYQLFNPVTSWCDWIYSFPCLDEPRREECPREEGRFLKPGTECKVYYDCCNGEPTEKSCPPDQLFDPNKEKCEWSELYTCVEQPDPKVCQEENGRFLKPGTDCKSYYDCRYGKPTERECPQDQLFDPSKRRCEWDDLYTCIDKPIQEKCLKDNGRFLNPGTHCKSYFDCRNGIPTEKVCPDGELFDPSTESCEWSELYTCVEDLSTTMSTTSTVFETSTPTTSDDNQNYKTSDRTPSTSSQPSTRSRIGVTGSSTIYTSISDFSDHGTSNQPHSSTTSSYTTSDPYTRSSTSKLGSSSTHAITAGTSDYESTSTTNSYTASDPEIRSSTSKLGSSSTHASTTATSDYESTRTTNSYPGSDPDIQSSTSKLGSSSTHASTAGTSDYESTRNPYSSTTDSYTASDPDIRSSIGTLGSSSKHASTSDDITDKESTRKPHTSTVSYTSTDSKIRPSTRGFRSSLPDVRSTSGDNIFCPEPNGYFPHPTNKHMFVGCVNNVPNVLTCPSNLVYIHKLRRCDYERR